MAPKISTPLVTFNLSQLSSQTVIYVLLWRDFEDVTNVPNQFVLEKDAILGEPDLITWV